MKQFIVLILTAILTGLFISCGQTSPASIYNSSAENDESPSTDNKVNDIDGIALGYLQVVNGKDTLILDFHSTEVTLTIEENEELVYEYLPKLYSTSTTDGKTFLEFQTQLQSNILSILLNGTKFSSGVFNEENDVQFPGLSINSISKNNVEYLSLYVAETIMLSTAYQFPKNESNEFESYKPVKAITVLPGSNIIFKIKK